MIGTEFRYTPEYKPSDLSQRVSAPFQQLSASMRQQQEAQRKAQAEAAAVARKEQLAERNRQYSKLYGVAGKGFDGWSEQTIKEYEKQFMQSMDKVMGATTQEEAKEMLAAEILRLERLHSVGGRHAKLYTGQNSAHDQYVQWDAGAIPWRVDGMEPITSPEDLAERESRWENSTVNLRTENVGGYETSVGDYVAPNGMLIKDEAEQMFQSQGIPYDIQTDPNTGMVSIVPQSEEMKPIVIGGPLMQHPNLGSRQWFMPESQSIAMPFAEFAANTGLRKNVQDIEANYNSDESPITRDEAMATARGAAMTIYMNDPRAQAGAAQLYQEIYGVPFNENDFVVNPNTGQSTAQAEGRAKRPEELYMDKVMPILGSFQKKEKSTGSSSITSRKNETLWTDVDKSLKTGLPSDINYSGEESAKLSVYGNDRETIESLSESESIELVVPEEIGLQFEGEKVNVIRMYRDDNVLLVAKVGADTEGKMIGGLSADNMEYYNSPGFWEKYPESKYFVVPIFGEDGDYSTQFKALENNIKEEYKRAGDLSSGDTPLRNMYRQGI